MNSILDKIKKFFDTWLNPEKTDSLEEAISKYHIPPEAAKLLLETANGINIDSIEEQKRESRQKYFHRGNKTKTNSEYINHNQGRIEEDINIKKNEINDIELEKE